jgi:hypothetical protein
MSDREWLRQIDEWDGTEDEEEVEILTKKKGKVGRRPIGARGGEAGESGSTPPEPAKRGRKRKKVMDEEVVRT